MMGRRLSWSRENDHVWGPFLYCRDRRGYRPIAIEASSGNGEEYAGATLRFSGFGHTFIVALPQWLLPPERKKVDCSGHWDAATVARLGRDWYWAYTPRQYGFTFSERSLHIHFGRQPMCSPGDKTICWFIPWANRRFVRHSHYTPTGEHIKTFFEADRPKRKSRGKHWTEAEREAAWAHRDAEYTFEKALPTVDFDFLDFDGERITARTRIEEREWRHGTGWFKWLSWFVKPTIRRSLDLSFSNETGRRKGSWKGGTTGHAVDIAVGETPESAFARYCAEHEMTFPIPETKAA